MPHPSQPFAISSSAVAGRETVSLLTVLCRVSCFTAFVLGFYDFEKLGKRIKWLILPLHESETDRHLIGLSG